MMKLKVADRSDIKDILYLFKDKSETPDEILEEELIDAPGKDRIVLAYIDDRPVGLLRSRLVENPDGSRIDEVLTMIIARDAYGKGVGGALLEEEREFAASFGARLLRLKR